MVFIEPVDSFLCRVEKQQYEAERKRQELQHQVDNPAEHPDGWDAVIMAYFIEQPRAVILYMRAVNALVRHCRARLKKDREKAKIVIIRAMGRLIREGRLKRVRRRFVRVNAAEVPQKPLIPLSDSLSGSGTLQPRKSVGSTTATGMISPAIFV